MFSVWRMTLCVLAVTDSKVMQSGYWRFRGVPGVGSYVNNDCQHVEISLWIEYACGVKSETITLVRRVDLRCAWTSFRREEILGCILPVRLGYASLDLGYDTSTRYFSKTDFLSLDDSWYTVMDQSQESGDVDSNTHVQLTVNYSALFIQHCRFSEYSEFFCNSSLRCSCNRQDTNNLNHTCRFRCTWYLESCLQGSVSQFHMDNVQWRWYVTAALPNWQKEKCTAPQNLA